MKRFRALWNLLVSTDYLLVTHRTNKQGQLQRTTYDHNMTPKEVQLTIAAMYCHTNAEAAAGAASEILAKGLAKG